MANQAPRSAGGRRRTPRKPPPVSGTVVDLVPVRIERALAARQRYKYVHPRVQREGGGWKIVSPNCSRNVDPQGGEIDIAWLVPVAAGPLPQGPAQQGRWQLHARDHAQACWRLEGSGLTLAEALERLCADPLRMYWP